MMKSGFGPFKMPQYFERAFRTKKKDRWPTKSVNKDILNIPASGTKRLQRLKATVYRYIQNKKEVGTVEIKDLFPELTRGELNDLLYRMNGKRSLYCSISEDFTTKWSCRAP